MNELIVVGIAKDAMRTALYVAGPALLVSMVVGLSISIFQVVTSLQDQTVAFVPKIVAVMATVVISFPWMIHTLGSFATRMFSSFNEIVKQLP